MLSLSATRLLLLRTRFLLFTVTPALLPLGGLVLYTWLPEALLKYFFFTKGWVPGPLLNIAGGAGEGCSDTLCMFP